MLFQKVLLIQPSPNNNYSTDLSMKKVLKKSLGGFRKVYSLITVDRSEVMKITDTVFKDLSRQLLKFRKYKIIIFIKYTYCLGIWCILVIYTKDMKEAKGLM